MKRFVANILAITLAVSGCSNNQLATDTPPEPSSSATPAKVIASPSYTLTVAKTLLPTATNTPAITPTFDPATIITRTPSTAVECPQIADIQSPNISKPEFPILSFEENKKTVLDFLNQGGNPDFLIKSLVNSGWLYNSNKSTQIKDITGDGVAEIIISPSETYVLGCQDTKFSILLEIENVGIAINTERNQIAAIEDMNKDGVPELVVASYGCGGFGAGMCLDGWVYEWDGNQFMSILELSMIGRQTSGAQPAIEVKNTNNDDLLELTVSGGILSGGDYYYFFPWRQETEIYGWNGNGFVLQNILFSNPQFRYQVIQDADRAALNGKYDEALKMYQNAIYGNYDWFSEERKQYIIDKANGIQNLTEPDLDPNEQLNLAGYAFFRIIVTYVLQKNLSEAQAAYERIHKNFSEGSAGYDYVIIADEFWNEYQSSQDLEKACGKAIEYAANNQSLLNYLGGEYHNTFQDTVYEPMDICPFIQ